jgi:hypothetical protein
VIFSSNVIKISQVTEQSKKERKKKKRRERKAPRVSSNKGEVNILIGEKHFDFKNPF